METKKQVENQVIMTEITAVMDTRDKTKVRQVRMKSDKGIITFKPVIRGETTKILTSGLKIVEQVTELMTEKELPNNIYNIITRIAEKGNAQVLVKYTEWQTQDMQGEDVVYRFVPTMDDFKNIKLID